ncbi:Signal transduction histidine kinase [Lentzea waywayandensis]|uniref:histidine kinase n=1 Tax=Lentzea waywayandensis TaxID=84724 RepID=A0A1I6FDM6_9PSEU|nr:HAMP domain-containing sensor histidine kinase [Lentzea waywayandensis]SFR28075.1 Signal transduction histidine kinase [Lentzea waywayandensis]
MSRLRRLRWQLTALFTLTTAVCLAVLAILAGVIDQRSRSDAADAEINRQATGLSRAVYYLNGTLHLEPLGEDYLARDAEGVLVVARSERGWEPRYERGRKPVADPATIEQVLGAEDVVLTGGPDGRLAAAPVWDESRIGAIVLVAAGPAGEGHAVLVRWLWIGCLALVLVAAAAGHLLSKLSMRPAVRSLTEQEQFLAEAAHELRTPLATLRLVAGSAEVRRQVDRLGHLVTGLLTRARVRGGTQEIERTPLRLDQLVEQVIDELAPGSVRLTAEPVVVHGDPELFAQAVRNLVDNAMRHGGGDVEVSVTAGAVSVVDNGPGLGRSRSGTGHGIGLAIVRWVAQLHGGSVRLTDRAEGGVIAEIRLPASR